MLGFPARWRCYSGQAPAVTSPPLGLSSQEMWGLPGPPGWRKEGESRIHGPMCTGSAEQRRRLQGAPATHTSCSWKSSVPVRHGQTLWRLKQCICNLFFFNKSFQEI